MVGHICPYGEVFCGSKQREYSPGNWATEVCRKCAFVGVIENAKLIPEKKEHTMQMYCVYCDAPEGAPHKLYCVKTRQEPDLWSEAKDQVAKAFRIDRRYLTKEEEDTLMLTIAKGKSGFSVRTDNGTMHYVGSEGELYALVRKLVQEPRKAAEKKAKHEAERIRLLDEAKKLASHASELRSKADTLISES